MKIVFAGTPVFATTALDALYTAGHEIALVLTQPDRPRGRGLQPLPSEVKRFAVAHGLRVAQPLSLRDPDAFLMLQKIGADLMVVAAYGLILPDTILRLPGNGCLNIHASLLPRWRGAAPIQRALLAGDSQTGISIMQMDAGLDTGPILLQQSISISERDTTQTLHDRLAALGAALIVRALEEPLEPKPQDGSFATYAPKIEKAEAQIDWSKDAVTIERQVRAFNPIPGAVTSLAGVPLKIWRAALAPSFAAPAGVVQGADRGDITVACGSGGALKVLELQRAGGKRLEVSAFLLGNPVKPGDRFGS